MLTRSQIDKRLAETTLTPLHAQAEGVMAKPKKKKPPVSDDKPRDLQDVEDPDTCKRYEFLQSARMVTTPQDIGPGGLFTGKRLPPDEAPHVTPGPVSPGRFGGISRVTTADQVLTTRLPGGD